MSFSRELSRCRRPAASGPAFEVGTHTHRFSFQVGFCPHNGSGRFRTGRPDLAQLRLMPCSGVASALNRQDQIADGSVACTASPLGPLGPLGRAVANPLTAFSVSV
jgi:hypothetical protein